MQAKYAAQLVNYSRAMKGDLDANSLIKVEMDRVIRFNLEGGVKQSNNIHDGYLYKQGNNYLKRWKQSYFVIEDDLE